MPLHLRAALALPLLIAASLATLSCDDDGGEPDPAQPAVTFADGVASGDVTATSAVVWTRAEGADQVVAQIAESEDLEDAREIPARAQRQTDFTVKVLVDGLSPQTRYHYRFRAGDAMSVSGTFVTAPAETTSAPVRFAYSGDSDANHVREGATEPGDFSVLDAAAADDPAFFIYLGDTIYSDRPEPVIRVQQYRDKYRQNRAYAGLRDFLASMATYAMWDDHEIINDAVGTLENPARFGAALTAFREYFPIADPASPTQLYRSFRYGKDVQLIILDLRSFRSESAAGVCSNGGPDPLPAGGAPDASEVLRTLRTGAGLPELPAGCIDAINDPARTILGATQKQWLKDELTSSDATWKVVVTSVPVQGLLALPYDRWEGYSAERREVLEFIRDQSIVNVVFLTTDLHANVFGPVRVAPGEEPVAYEAAVGPIATAPLQRDIETVAGVDAANLYSSLLTGVAGAECAQLDSYAYGLVEADAGSLVITAKDDTGAELCRKELEAQ